MDASDASGRRINGPAIGAGLQFLAMQCDLRAVADASQLPTSKYGLAPDN